MGLGPPWEFRGKDSKGLHNDSYSKAMAAGDRMAEKTTYKRFTTTARGLPWTLHYKQQMLSPLSLKVQMF